MEQLVAEGIQRTIPIPDGQNLDLNMFPNVDFYYKLVAKVDSRFYSIYDGKTQYEIGKPMVQKAMSGHRGGYYCYASVKEAVFADIPFKEGGLFIAPRTVLKCICWGDFVCYGSGKMAFSNLMPVGDLGLPLGYKASKSAVIKAAEEKNKLKYGSLEKKWDRCLVKRNNTSSEMPENNLFDNYFDESTVRRVEALING